jgi:HK97 family phage major capsid protein
MNELDRLRQQWQEKHDAAVALADKEDATPDDIKAAESLFDERDGLARQVEEVEARMKAASTLKGRAADGQKWQGEAVRTLPFPAGKVEDVQGGKGVRYDLVASEHEKKARTGGFKSLGHLAWCLARAGRNGVGGDPSAVQAIKSWDDLGGEMRFKAPSGLFEESDPDGGIFVPVDYSTDVYRRMVETNDLLQLVNPRTVTGNQLEYRVLKENSRADGFRGGGMRSYWIGEADQYQPSKPQYAKRTLKLHKLTALTYITEELLADSDIAVDAQVSDLAVAELNFNINDKIIRGNGAGMPEGILNSGSKITVSAVTGQGANTFIYDNVLAMFARIVSGQRKSLVWLYNQDVEPQLYRMYMPTGTAAGVAVLTPNVAGNGFNLMGRRALVIEQAESLGTAGDVIAFATDGYAAIMKGGVNSSMNMWARWDYDERGIKWSIRMDGMPKDDVPLTPYKGANTVSSIVVLNGTRT